MCIIKWFVQKIKKSVQDYQAKRWYRWWCTLSEEDARREILGEEEYRREKQWQLECEEAERQHYKEVAEEKTRQLAEHEKQLNHQRERDEDAYYERMESRCRGCGEIKRYCSCYE